MLSSASAVPPLMERPHPPAAAVQFRVDNGLCYLCGGRCLRCQPFAQARGRKRAQSSTSLDVDARQVASCAADIQTMLGFRSEAAGRPDLLLQALSYLCTSADLVKTRAVCCAFRICSDEVAATKTGELIGNGIEPMVGQSVTGLLHGAETADGATREFLKEWNSAAGEAEGFHVGLPTTKIPMRDALAVIEIEPSGTSEAKGNVPVRLVFKQPLTEGLVGTLPYLPRGFLHVNAYPDGRLFLCSRTRADMDKETTIIDTLRRVKEDLLSPDLACPHSGDAYHLYFMDAPLADNAEPSKEFAKYQKMCVAEFSGYMLGQLIPSLQVFHELAKVRVELMKAQRSS